VTFDGFLRSAEEALRVGDLELARDNYWAASQVEPADPLVRMRLGLTLKQLGRLHDALDEFTTVTRLSPQYGEAWKEKGIIEGMIARTVDGKRRPSWLHDGQDSLERATRLIPDDFDAWSSLAGVLKNVKGDRAAAARQYAHAAEISNGHPYPLLNAIRLEAELTGHLDLTSHAELLQAAESLRRAQMMASPATDAPWSHFDVAEICAYRGDQTGFLTALRAGLEHVTADYQAETFKRTLQDLTNLGVQVPGLAEALQLLDAKIASIL
jgi:Flp pilus assembly protein TadD